MLNLQNCGTLSCDRPWKRNLRLHTNRMISDKTIFKMAADRHLEFSKFGILVMCPMIEHDSALFYKISR